MPSHEDDMRELERRYNAGQERALLDAVFVCICSLPAKPVPRWASNAFLKRYGRIISAEARSWDAVFGKPWAKGTHLKAEQRKIADRYEVWRAIRSRNAGNGDAVSESLYEEVAAEMNVGKQYVRTLYETMQRAGGARSNLWRPHKRKSPRPR